MSYLAQKIRKSSLFYNTIALLLFTNSVIFTSSANAATPIGGVDLGNLTNYLFVFTNSYDDANLQAATKGFLGDIAVDGIQASERTSGTSAYSGTIYTNGSTQDAWQNFLDDNPSQSTGFTGESTRIAGLETDLVSALQQINALTATPGYTSVSSTSLDGLNTQNGTAETFVINITTNLTFTSKINITGDAEDIYILRWDDDGNISNGYQGQVKISGGGAIVPNGDLIPTNFINVAGDINSSGGGAPPLAPYPQGPRYNNGLGPLITGGTNFTSGGFFTGYWLTTGKPDNFDVSSGLYYGNSVPQSNGTFVGGWFTITDKFSITGGTSGVHIGTPTLPLPDLPIDLVCPTDYQLETWPASAPSSNTFDSSNGLLRLTASESFTNATHPSIGGIHTGSSYGVDSETITISSIDTSVTDIKNLRILSYDLDSETSSDRDYSYITFNSVNAFAISTGTKVEPHASIPNAYIAILGSGGASGADPDYHAGYVVEGISDGSNITMTSGYSGAGTVSFVGYQACIKSAGIVSGKVFRDTNSNDTFDSSDTGITDIKVWAQLVNTDGSVDPTEIPANTDASGNYQISSLADGNYQIHVDISDSDLPSDHIFSGSSNPILLNISNNNVTDVDFPFDEVICTALTGEISEIGIPLSGQLKTTDKLFVPSKDVGANTGHLRAYAVDAGGNAATKASWDAATVMNSIDRKNNLYSSDSGGGKKSFDSIGDIPYSTRQYIIDAPLGSISRGNELDLLTQKMDIGLYLSNIKYRKHYEDHILTRDQLVLNTSDDGFLYAFNYDTGALVWAWMPHSLQTELTSNDSYQNKHLMAGSVEILDLPDDSGDFYTYVVGSYKKGLGHYVLKLHDDGSLEKIIWDEDQSSTYTESPNNGEMEFFKDINGYVYAVYVLSNTTVANTSTLKIRSLTEDTTDISVNLNYQATSTPFVMFDFDKRNAPSKSTLYLGNQVGSIHNADLLNNSGLLRSTYLIRSDLEGTSVTAMDDSSSDAVLYIDASVSSADNRYYLSSQSASRLSIHRYHSSDQTWHKAWTSYVSGAGTWDSSDNYSDDSSGVPSKKGGFAIVPPTTGIQSLPVTARITAKATIVGDRVVLPLTVLDSASSGCYGKAYYYLYRLSDGNFPTQSFIKKDGTVIVDNIALGYGEASQLAITDLAGTNKLLGYGVADKDVNLNSGIATSFIIKDPMTTGVRGWKEIGR